MTEQEWLECADPIAMMTHLGGKVSDRKLRLLAVACCRRIWHLLTDERSRKAVEVADNLADGGCIETARREAMGNSRQAFFDNCSLPHSVQTIAQNPAAEAAYLTVGEDRPDFVLLLVEEAEKDGSKDSALLRDIVGNPFRPVPVDPTWRTPTAVAIAQAIYDERAFDRLPILADALEDAGCDSADILNHCRQPAEHVRGCWCVDLILSKGR